MAVEHTETMKVDNIKVKVFEPPEIRYWNSLGVNTKILLSEKSGVIESVTARNTTTLEMHEWLVGRSDPNGQQTSDISELAVGRSSTTVSESDTGLNDEVDRVEITSTAREGDALRVKTFLDKKDGNVNVSGGESLSEVGLYAESNFLNHAVLSTNIDKTNNKTATIDVLITYDAV